MDLKKTLYFFSSIHYNEAKLHFERMFTMEENKNSSNIRIPRVLYNCLLGFFVIVFLVSLILIARYSIESFRNSFPYKIADGYILYNIMRINLQVGKASTWQIVGDFNGDLWECSIVRPHTQSYKELLTLVASTKEPTEVGALNQSETLLWE